MSLSSSLRSQSEVQQVTPLTPTSVRDKVARISQAFDTINKLQFDSVGLVGREKEMGAMNECFDRLVSPGGTKRELVLVRGNSGTGKTALALTLKQNVKQARGAFVSAKYDATFRDNQPYSGISAACNELCRVLLERNTSEDDMVWIRKELFEHIDKSQISVIETIVPLLSIIAFDESSDSEEMHQDFNNAAPETDLECGAMNPNEDNYKHRGRRRGILRRRKSGPRISKPVSLGDNTSLSSSGGRNSGVDPKCAKEVLNMAFRRLIRILTSRIKPVVILLDDLQWADSPSLELIETILDDKAIENLMIIGCDRSDEVDESHTISNLIRRLKEDQTNNSNFTMSELAVGNLSLEALDAYIRKLLSVPDPKKTLMLSSICHRRTLGNIYFVKVFLSSLYDATLLNFNTATFQWNWVESRIEAQTAATDNLINFLTSKMIKFPKELLLLLKMASCLGNTFDKKTIFLLWEQAGQAGESSLDKLLQMAVDEMFFEKLNHSSYRFVHDKVQESAALLIPKDEYNAFHKDIGSCLYQELDQMLFVVIDLLNSGNDATPDTALLNLKAAKKSMELAAFASAARYIKYGIGCVREHHIWDDYFELALQLHTVGSEAEACIGNKEKSGSYCREILKQKRIAPVHQLRVYKVMIEQLHDLCKYDESWALCEEILGKLGLRYPRYLARQRLKTILYLRQTKKHHLPNAKEINNLPIISDPQLQEMIRLMVVALPQVMATGRRYIYVLLCCQGVRLTKRYGITEYTGSLFTSFANVLMHRYGDWSTAIKVADAALNIQSRLDSNYTRTSTLMKTNFVVLGWVRPLKGVWSSLMEAYRIGMLSGNIDGAGMGVISAISCQFFSGSSLRSVEDDLQIYTPQIEALKLQDVAYNLRALWQVVLDLMGQPGSPKKADSCAVFDLHQIGLPSMMKKFMKMWICYKSAYLGEYETGAAIALQEEDSLYRQILGFSFFGFFFFPQGLCLYARARVTKQRKYLIAARKIRGQLQQWAKQGAVNFLHQLFLLDAEDAILRGHQKAANKCYLKAIRTAARSGFIQDAGMATERYALFLVSVDGPSDAEYYFEESIRYYSEWGSIRKVDQLKEALAGIESY
jgi:predicted ATPase